MMADSPSSAARWIVGGVALGAAAAIGFWRGRRTAPGARGAGGTWGSINRPTAGPRFERALPRGTAPLQLYSCGTPNGHKVTILLEELGLAYDAHFISIMAGDQFGSEFTARCPNSKIPMLVDQAHATTAAEKAGGHSIFESGAIMLHLAEKTGSGLLPADPAQRSECLQWLFFQVGAGPFFGQFGHFHKYAPGAAQGRRIVYAHERYTMEVQRLCDVLERALADERPFLLGQQLTLADLAWFPWVRCLSTFYAARAELELEARFPRLMAWEKRLGERPAFVRGMRVNAFDATPEYKNYSTAGS